MLTHHSSHRTAAGVVERLVHQNQGAGAGTHTEWRLDGEEIAVDAAAGLLSQEVPRGA